MNAKEKTIAIGAITTLAALAAATPEMIIRALTGALFTTGEAEQLVTALHGTHLEMSEEILSEIINARPS
jgi:hypothetical protein